MSLDVATLMSEIGEIESEIKMLEIKKQSLRDRIVLHMKLLGVNKITVDRIGTATMTANKKRVTYDSDGLESLTAQLLQDGDIGNANAIALLRKESISNGYLIIKKEK